MAVRRYMLRLYRGLTRKGPEVFEYLDIADDDRLRELLVARVTAVMDTTDVRLDQGWELVVLGPGGSPRHARVGVDSAGRTVVKR
jgi:hypothetical protein